MFWPVILPMQITLLGMIGVNVVAVLIAPKLKWRRPRVFAWSILLGVLGFVPSCTAVQLVADQFRFGAFSYPDHESINDFRVQRFLPDAATDITVQKQSDRFRARFKIDESSLDEWFEKYWDYAEKHSIDGRHEKRTVSAEAFARQFSGLDWVLPDEAVEYICPHAGNGAGGTIWYSRADGIAFEYAGYW